MPAEATGATNSRLVTRRLAAVRRFGPHRGLPHLEQHDATVATLDDGRHELPELADSRLGHSHLPRGFLDRRDWGP